MLNRTLKKTQEQAKDILLPIFSSGNYIAYAPSFEI